jgi:hypothetical protein
MTYQYADSAILAARLDGTTRAVGGELALEIGAGDDGTEEAEAELIAFSESIDELSPISQCLEEEVYHVSPFHHSCEHTLSLDALSSGLGNAAFSRATTDSRSEIVRGRV